MFATLTRNSLAAPSSILDPAKKKHNLATDNVLKVVSNTSITSRSQKTFPTDNTRTSTSPFTSNTTPPWDRKIPPASVYKVIVVDDSKSYTIKIKKLLERAVKKFSVKKTLNIITMTDPVQALRVMTQQRFSLCLVDNVFSESSLSGIEILNRLDAAEQETSVVYSPRVLVSGQPLAEIVRGKILTKNDLGVGLLHDLLRAQGKCLTMFESSQARLPPLSGAARLRLNNGNEAATMLLRGAVLFWGDRQNSVEETAAQKEAEKRKELEKKGLSGEFIDFLGSPYANEGRNTQRPTLEGGAAFVNANDWEVNDMTRKGKAHRKLSYTFTREALQQQQMLSRGKAKAKRSRSRRHSQLVPSQGVAAATVTGAGVATKLGGKRRNTVHVHSVPAAMWISKPKQKGDKMIEKQNFWKQHREDQEKNNAASNRKEQQRQEREKIKLAESRGDFSSVVQTETAVLRAIRQWKALGGKRKTTKNVHSPGNRRKSKFGATKEEQSKILEKETEAFRELSRKLEAHGA
jgi:hypothetical protein